MQNFKDFLERNKWAILFVASAVVLVLLICFLRWWTLLVVPVLVLSVFFGHLMDKGGPEAVKHFFDKLFSKVN